MLPFLATTSVVISPPGTLGDCEFGINKKMASFKKTEPHTAAHLQNNQRIPSSRVSTMSYQRLNTASNAVLVVP